MVWNPVKRYLVDWPAFVQLAEVNEAKRNLDWFHDSIEDGEPWVVDYTRFTPEWYGSASFLPLWFILFRYSDLQLWALD